MLKNLTAFFENLFVIKYMEFQLLTKH